MVDISEQLRIIAGETKSQTRSQDDDFIIDDKRNLISNELRDIRSERYGLFIRTPIHDALDKLAGIVPEPVRDPCGMITQMTITPEDIDTKNTIVAPAYSRIVELNPVLEQVHTYTKPTGEKLETLDEYSVRVGQDKTDYTYYLGNTSPDFFPDNTVALRFELIHNNGDVLGVTPFLLTDEFLPDDKNYQNSGYIDMTNNGTPGPRKPPSEIVEIINGFTYITRSEETRRCSPSFIQFRIDNGYSGTGDGTNKHLEASDIKKATIHAYVGGNHNLSSGTYGNIVIQQYEPTDDHPGVSVIYSLLIQKATPFFSKIEEKNGELVFTGLKGQKLLSILVERKSSSDASGVLKSVTFYNKNSDAPRTISVDSSASYLLQINACEHGVIVEFCGQGLNKQYNIQIDRDHFQFLFTTDQNGNTVVITSKHVSNSYRTTMLRKVRYHVEGGTGQYNDINDIEYLNPQRSEVMVMTKFRGETENGTSFTPYCYFKLQGLGYYFFVSIDTVYNRRYLSNGCWMILDN